MIKPLQIKHLLAILFICWVASLYYWNVNPASYPWWHRFNNDIDATHATTTIGLLNNSKFTFIYHPAATISFIHGTAYRLLAAVDPSHQKLLHLDQIDRFEDAFDLIATATKTSRYIIWLTYLGFILVVYGVLWRLTQSVLLSFLFAFYITCCPTSLIHSIIIRPEIPTLIFALWSAYVFLGCCSAKKSSLKNSLLSYTAVGFLMGFALLSKIQIIPVLLVLFLLMTSYLYYSKNIASMEALLSDKRLIILFVLVNTTIFPWWCFSRPGFMTEEYLKNLNPHSDLSIIYGPAPKTMAFLPLMAFCFVMIITGFLLKTRKALHNKLGLLFVWFNGLLLGLSLSIYAVLLPVSATLHQYLENTHYMVYATMTNIVFRGYLSQQAVQEKGFSILSWVALHRILKRLNDGNISGIYLGLIIIGAVILCFWQIFSKDIKRRGIYLLAIICFLTAFLMDVLSLQRDPHYKPIYFIYTITLYGIGLSVVACHMKSKAAQGIIAVVLLFHVFSTMPSWKISLHGQAVSDQNPMVEWTYLQAYAEPFWNMVNEALRKNI